MKKGVFLTKFRMQEDKKIRQEEEAIELLKKKKLAETGIDYNDYR